MQRQPKQTKKLRTKIRRGWTYVLYKLFIRWIFKLRPLICSFQKILPFHDICHEIYIKYPNERFDKMPNQGQRGSARKYAKKNLNPRPKFCDGTLKEL